MDELRAAMEKDDLEEIKSKMRAMDEVMHRISQRLYQQTQAQGTQSGAPGQDQSKQDDDVVDADYTEAVSYTHLDVYKRQQLEGIRLAANEELIKDLLPVLDNFERAMQAKREEQAEDPFFQGMEMVFRGLQEALANHGLQPIEAVGQPFDPNLHEAVAMEGTGGEELSVLAQVQTGYLLHDKVLRHTKVLVGQGEEEEKQCQK